MMASEDRWNDDDDLNDAEDTLSVREVARQQVKIPALMLILLGILTILFVGLAVIQYPTLPAQFEAERKKVDADDKLQDDQKALAKDILNRYEKILVAYSPVMWGVLGVGALLTIVAGVRVRNLSGRGLALVMAVINMLPIVSGCCCLGIPVGVWLIVVLSRPDVVAGFAAQAAFRRSPDVLR